MNLEDYENQPHLGDGGASFGAWIASVWEDQSMVIQLYWTGLFPLISYKCEGMKDSKVSWVKPKKLIKSAEKMKNHILNKKRSIKKIIHLYSKHAVGEESPEEEFFNNLNDVIRIAEFVEKVGGKRMAFEINF